MWTLHVGDRLRVPVQIECESEDESTVKISICVPGGCLGARGSLYILVTPWRKIFRHCYFLLTSCLASLFLLKVASLSSGSFLGNMVGAVSAFSFLLC